MEKPKLATKKPRTTKKRPREPSEKDPDVATLLQLQTAARDATTEAEKAFHLNKCTYDFLLRPPRMRLEEVGPYTDNAQQFVTHMELAMHARMELFAMIKNTAWGDATIWRGGYLPCGGALSMLQHTGWVDKPLFRKLLEELTTLIWQELRTAGFYLLDECETPEQFVELKLNIGRLNAVKEHAVALLAEDQELTNAADAFWKALEK